MEFLTPQLPQWRRRVIDSYLTSSILSLNDIILTDIRKLGVKVIEEWEVEMMN